MVFAFHILLHLARACSICCNLCFCFERCRFRHLVVVFQLLCSSSRTVAILLHSSLHLLPLDLLRGLLLLYLRLRYLHLLCLLRCLLSLF